MKILVVGAGVIGSVYACKLVDAGHDVTIVAREERLTNLRTFGLVIENAESGVRSEVAVSAVSAPDPALEYDLVLVSVRSEQLASTLPLLTSMTDGSDVLFFGNTGGRNADLVRVLGSRAVFGFPAAGGTRDGHLIRYVLIDQQKTLLGEAGRESSPRVRALKTTFERAGFSVAISPHIDRWLICHAAFVVPIAFALYAHGTDASRLAADRDSVRAMVRATRQAFHALQVAGNAEIPTNLKALYLWMPSVFAVRYWQKVLRTARGELWFAAHSRAAPEEMRSLANELLAEVRRCRKAAPALELLLAG
jgi:2-dehydropantoate 2-reductase